MKGLQPVGKAKWKQLFMKVKKPEPVGVSVTQWRGSGGRILNHSRAVLHLLMMFTQGVFLHW